MRLAVAGKRQSAAVGRRSQANSAPAAAASATPASAGRAAERSSGSGHASGRKEDNRRWFYGRKSAFSWD